MPLLLLLHVRASYEHAGAATTALIDDMTTDMPHKLAAPILSSVTGGR